MKRKPDLFVGITSWNSSLFLPVCLDAVFKKTADIGLRAVVLDNASTDGSAEIARSFGVEVLVERCSQGDALTKLLALSDAPYTLLLHADVVLLDSRWFDLCRSMITDKTILVSPEDIGCGPYSRPFGIGKPESSFMFAVTKSLRRTQVLQWRAWHRLLIPRRVVDFYGEHVTHNLPRHLRAHGYGWHPMLVHASDLLDELIYRPAFKPLVWSEELGYLRYGLGNFYSIDGVLTHYHNWYERLFADVEPSSHRTTGQNGSGFPLAFINAYTRAFLRDHAAGKLVLPPAVKSTRVPMVL
jgi:glycosyltransferase involved in cell wall biosynthesis